VEVKINSTGDWLWAEYDNMTVQSENDNYLLHVTGYHGNAGDAFHHNRGQFAADGKQFSTRDVDNDENPNGNCAAVQGGGWWYGWCSSSRLNSGSKPTWFASSKNVVSASRMMLQCISG